MEQVYWITEHIYKIRVLVQQVEVSIQKLSGLTTGKKSLREWIGFVFMKEEELIIM